MNNIRWIIDKWIDSMHEDKRTILCELEAKDTQIAELRAEIKVNKLGFERLRERRQAKELECEKLREALKICIMNEESQNRLDQVDAYMLRQLLLHINHVAREALETWWKFREGGK